MLWGGRWERLVTMDMRPAQELRGMQGADWWCLDVDLPEVASSPSAHC